MLSSYFLTVSNKLTSLVKIHRLDCCVALFRFSIFMVLHGALLACQSSSVANNSQCGSRDWYEIGRQEGAQGNPARNIASISCLNKEDSTSWARYHAGRLAGLAEFCTEENGFFLGKANLNYVEGTCPEALEPAFMRAFQRGLQVRELEQANHLLLRQIRELSQQILSDDSSSLQQELSALKRQQSETLSQINELQL